MLVVRKLIHLMGEHLKRARTDFLKVVYAEYFARSDIFRLIYWKTFFLNFSRRVAAGQVIEMNPYNFMLYGSQ